MKVEPEFDAVQPPGRGVWALSFTNRAVCLLDDLVTTLFPADCRCCDAPLRSASTVPVCMECIASISRSTMPVCSVCGEGLDIDPAFEDMRSIAQETLLCRECRMAPPDFARAVTYGLYGTQLRELIRLLKFEHVRAVAPLLGGRLAETILALQGEAGAELLVVAVPLFRQRERERGYNQSILLANAALSAIKRVSPGWTLRPAHGVLVRQRSTESSFVLSRRGRRRNLRGAFRMSPGAEDVVREREVLLIDDIYTSGATARECARVLMRAGATKVWVATLARAQKRSILNFHHAAVGERTTATWNLEVNPKHATSPEG